VIRAFVAVKLDSLIIRRICELAVELNPGLPGVRWVPAENLHLTLKFLGAVDEERLATVAKGLAGVVRDFPRFSIHAKGLGVFPDLRRARVLWVGLHGDSLQELASQIETASEFWGFARERRAFAPHLTIGRWRQYDGSPVKLRHELERWKECEFGSSAVEQVFLFQSVLHRQGAVYRPLKLFPLK
jgi:RNA 2',3'-cyclic 3'-phosphodiesterase